MFLLVPNKASLNSDGAQTVDRTGVFYSSVCLPGLGCLGMARLLSSKGKWEEWAAEGRSRREHRPHSGHPSPFTHPEIPLEQCSTVASTMGLGFSLTEKTQRLRERIQSAKCSPYKPGELSLSSRTCGKERKTTKKPETLVWLWTLIIPVVWVCR